VSGEDLVRPSRADGEAAPELADAFEAAIDYVVRLTLELTSAIAKLAYADGVRARGELEPALLLAQGLAQALPDASERSNAVRQIQAIGAVATRMLAIAPAPSSSAIKACDAGNRTAWDCEAQAWIAGRLASGPSSPGSRRRAFRSDTRPDSPRALRDVPSAEEVIPTPAHALDTSLAPMRDKGGTR
jgi:hypothetical protein